MNEEQERMLTAWNDPPASQAEEIAEARLWAAEAKAAKGEEATDEDTTP